MSHCVKKKKLSLAVLVKKGYTDMQDRITVSSEHKISCHMHLKQIFARAEKKHSINNNKYTTQLLYNSIIQFAVECQMRLDVINPKWECHSVSSWHPLYASQKKNYYYYASMGNNKNKNNMLIKRKLNDKLAVFCKHKRLRLEKKGKKNRRVSLLQRR